jgi:hypothetical protein
MICGALPRRRYADAYVFTRELEKLHPDILNRVWHPGSGFLGNASRDLDAYNRARCLAIALPLNSKPSTINHFATSGVCRDSLSPSGSLA